VSYHVAVTSKKGPPCSPFGSSAVLISRGGPQRGGEDPWLCGTGFRRLCLCRGELDHGSGKFGV